MNIFFQDRVIQFTSALTENDPIDTLVVPFQSEERLKEDWIRFRNHETFKKLVILDQVHESDQVHEPATDLFSIMVYQGIDRNLKAFLAFLNLFTLVPAAGGVVKNENGEILFIHRLGRWDLPKGKIDNKDLKAGDPATDMCSVAEKAAVREVQEETGLKKISMIREITSTWHIYTEKKKEILKRTFWFEMLASAHETLKPQASEGIFLAKWVPADAMSCVRSNTYASISDLLRHSIREQS